MASLAEQERTVEALRHGPRTYFISIGGYGGEMVYGRLTKEQFAYWEEHEDDFEEYMCSWDKDEEWPNVPEHARIEGEWYDNDDILHETGCGVSSAWVQVESENSQGKKEEIFSGSWDDFAKKFDVEHEAENSEELPKDAPYVYFGMSVEKGHFYTYSFSSMVPPQWNLLRYDTTSYPNGDMFFSNLYFVKKDGSIDDSIQIEDNGGDGTTGKAMYHELVEN
jgi:hypothetical protein